MDSRTSLHTCRGEPCALPIRGLRLMPREGTSPSPTAVTATWGEFPLPYYILMH